MDVDEAGEEGLTGGFNYVGVQGLGIGCGAGEDLDDFAVFDEDGAGIDNLAVADEDAGIADEIGSVATEIAIEDFALLKALLRIGLVDAEEDERQEGGGEPEFGDGLDLFLLFPAEEF